MDLIFIFFLIWMIIFFASLYVMWKDGEGDEFEDYY